MQCIGFGKYEKICTNTAGTKWSPYWCERCNKLRLEHIDKQFQELVKLHPRKPNDKPVQ